MASHDTPVLVLIDVQNGFDNPIWGRRNNPRAEQNMARLLHYWRELHYPIVHIQHLSRSATSPLRPDYFGSEIKALVQPIAGEPIFQKHVNSAFIGTDLEPWLRERGYATVIIVGLTTPHCVSTTARMAGNLGFSTYVVSDATAAFELPGPDGKHYDPETIHAVSLATLNGEFATILDTNAVLDLVQP